ncbi:DUF4244 domain-containing protein [Kibdelosporangium philippinense]|uniref:DUF4244 domain-containing protein n=1 Tax=Kibdelosporangium philippinense TaxID=211113 RepID=A0ABS8ZQ35_9PSEU|nr:DUF4244 domain-containing protein [Kibdelosporangium philippinense]MCE7009298.1 DUF4244 domain-containing protein [Kibdelosporangium philippinense]
MVTARRLHRFSGDEGAVTVEYAMLYMVVGTLGAIITGIIASEWFRNMILDLIKQAIGVP